MFGIPLDRCPNIADVRLPRAADGPPYSLCVPHPPPVGTPSSLPITLPAYIDALDGNIIAPGFMYCMPYPPGIMPIPPIPPIIGMPIAGTPIPTPIPLIALTLEPRSHSSFALASACCATAIWYACFATAIAC